MENKKIRNATAIKSCGISFKSQLEKTIYTSLIEQGFNPLYEPFTFTLWNGFQPVTPFFDKETDKQKLKRLKESGGPATKMLVLKNNKIVGIRYTPDFYFKYKDINIYIEAKGIENDLFYIKKKMFIKYLDNLYLEKNERSLYFEIYSKRQLSQAVEIIKDYATECN